VFSNRLRRRTRRGRRIDVAQIGRHDIAGQAAIERSENGLADGRALPVDIVIPEADDGTTTRAHEFVTATIIFATRMLAPVDLNDETLFATAEICKIWPDRMLTRKVISSELAAL
jgi:hypothetical protein